MTSFPHVRTDQFELHSGDIPESIYRTLLSAKRVAWDIETSGLEWRSDRIGLCQLHGDDGTVSLVQIEGKPPQRLIKLLEDSSVKKVFHHAMFDLRFMAHRWSAQPQNIACTKIAAKLLFPQQPESQKLEALLRRLLGVKLDKSEQRSNWIASLYSPGQIDYAVGDVLYLLRLFDVLVVRLRDAGRQTLAEQCFAHIPTRVQLEIGGFGDVFVY
ncbi:MAG: ribonuclease D [Thermoanaerobaculia bacterium]